MIVLIIGTNRPGSSTRRVARHLEEIYREMDVPVSVLDLAELPAEAFLPAAYTQKPKSFQPFSDMVLRADGLVVVTPEYNGGPPGILKHFIDLLKYPESLQLRPVCFVGLSSGMWGGLRPVEHLQQVFGYRNAHIYPERVFLPQVQELLGGIGRITNTEVMGRLRSQASGFVDFIERLKGINLKQNKTQS
jgi:NAD(P)H-dependent FMN reductase